jgi:hypothetical protein
LAFPFQLLRLRQGAPNLLSIPAAGITVASIVGSLGVTAAGLVDHQGLDV